MFKENTYFYKFLVFSFLVLIKNLVFMFFSVDSDFYWTLGVDYFLFWLALPKEPRAWVLSVVHGLSIGLLFLSKEKRFLGFDMDHQLPLILAIGLPFFIYLLIKKTYKRVIVAVFMSLAAWLNLELAQNFTGNVSVLNLFSNFLSEKFQMAVVLDKTVLSFMRTCFWMSQVIIFYEFGHQFFTVKSWRFYVEQICNKRSLFMIFIVFKPLIYWFIGSLIIVFLGESKIPLFPNKFSWLLAGLAYSAYLLVYAIYFRKFVSTYFYENLGIENYLYPLLVLPVIDSLAFLILLFFKHSQTKKRFKMRHSPFYLVYILVLTIIVYIFYYYFRVIKTVNLSELGSGSAAVMTYIFMPLCTISGIWISRKKANRYRSLIAILILFGGFLFLYSIPQIQSQIDVKVLVGTLLNYFLLLLAVFFVYPFLFLKEYLKI
jgi:hypothetical protein